MSDPPKFQTPPDPPPENWRPPEKLETPPGPDTPPPVNRITDTCKNITLAQLHCGR